MKVPDRNQRVVVPEVVQTSAMDCGPASLKCVLGRFVQVMDPATGRRWPSCEQFLSTVYLHTLPVPAATWRKWAGSDQFTSPLSRKLKALGLKEPGISRMLQSSLQADTWRPLAAL